MNEGGEHRGYLPELPLFYTVPMALAALGISRATFYRLVQANNIQLVKVGRKSVFRRDELERLIHELPAPDDAAAKRARGGQTKIS